MSEQKRFIAGAVCPACKASDKIVVYRDETGMHKECVACGESESLDQLGQQQELPTRVNAVSDGESRQSIQILDPRSLGKS